MKCQVLFFSHQAFSFPPLSLSLFFSTSARVLGNAQKCFLFKILTLVSQLSLLRKWVNPPFLHGSINFLLKEKTYASFTFRQCQYIYYVTLTIDLEGFFFSPHKPTRPTLPVCSEVHVWSVLQLILQGLVLALQVVLLPARGLLFSLLFFFLSRILQYRFALVVQGSVHQWCCMCCAPVTLCTQGTAGLECSP